MSDIVKRLRASVAMDTPNGSAFERSVCARQMLEAATEIERLRSELAGMTAAAESLQADVYSLMDNGAA